eukprot:CAMPEP_0203920138 /NCGR_PEP_ID=MMETSP0359-20131031/60475_1 /ASSEMBLY_ACC=CAM_ASM_000338 /TAXON_ID=268821 /ORGANISM="Scrippsiella Hangoei, Strain SHTV-5" /LENGTH=501 /DNA_ID=CAMNT_0050847577 /DNA_START=52 /DNA_END=1557 /DNA_ORIENTATION=+
MGMQGFWERLRPNIGYTTPVFIYVEDARLGIAYYILVVSVLLYVVVYDFAYGNQYLELEQPVGTIRMSFRMPTDRCDPLKNTCRLLSKNTSDMPYCLSDHRPAGVKDAPQVLPCVYMDGLEAVTDLGEQAMLATFVEEIQQRRICDGALKVGDKVMSRFAGGDLAAATIVSIDLHGDVLLDWDSGASDGREVSANLVVKQGASACERVWQTIAGPENLHPTGYDPGTANPYVRPSGVFVADIEEFTLLLDHSMSAPTLGISSDARKTVGYIYTEDSEMCRSHPSRAVAPVELTEDVVPSTSAPCYIRPNQTAPIGGLDFFTIGTLLGAAGVDLDTPSPVSGEEGHTNRREGVLLVINIMYKNFKPFAGAGDVYYEYKVFSIPTTPKLQKTFITNYPNQRVVQSIHGIKIHIIQSGKIGKFSLLRLMITIAAGLTMMAVANFVVDSVALYLLPERDHFSRLKYPIGKIKKQPGVPDDDLYAVSSHPAFMTTESEALSDSDAD